MPKGSRRFLVDAEFTQALDCCLFRNVPFAKRDDFAAEIGFNKQIVDVRCRANNQPVSDVQKYVGYTSELVAQGAVFLQYGPMNQVE